MKDEINTSILDAVADLAKRLDRIEEHLANLDKLEEKRAKDRERKRLVRGHENCPRTKENESGKESFPPAPPIEKRGKQEKNLPLARACEEFCERFWTDYPAGRRIAKRKCFDKLKARYLDAKDPDAFAKSVLDGLARWCSCPQWRDGIVCNAETFINQERWETQPDTAAPARNVARPRQVSATANTHVSEAKGMW